LALIFAVLILVFAGLCGALNFISAKNHQQEIIQRLNWDLAEHIAKEWRLPRGETWNDFGFNGLFDMLMIVNPSIELYMLDNNGAILSNNAPPGRVQLNKVSLAPIQAFLNKNALPIIGDNPRNPDRQEIFSATVLTDKDGVQVGYLYIVLSGDDYQRLADDVWKGHVFQSVMWTGAAILLLTLIVGLGLFFVVTRRLKGLISGIVTFDASGFSGELKLEPAVLQSPDEIGMLACTFTRMAERITTQMHQIKCQDEMRREMVANVSHDLRTPLTSMQGYLETMLRKSDQLSWQEQQTYLKVAVRQSQRVSHLAQELFELAKLECEEVKPEWEQFSVQELIQDVVQKFELTANSKKVQIGALFLKSVPFVYADIEMIERALTNLIDNALRYTPEGGKIELALSHEEGTVSVRVSDNGSGIPDEYLPTLFDRNCPLRKVREKHQGSGLGLLITKRILELHRCKIKVFSREGSGTTFTFSLPTYPSGRYV
jgi:signal transduction histidine kinase